MNRGYPFPGDVLERRHSDSCIPQQPPMNMVTEPSNGKTKGSEHQLLLMRKQSTIPKQPHTAEHTHPHFAMIYLDHNGQWQLQASPSIAGCEGAIFTPEVTDRFIEMTGQALQTSPQFTSEAIFFEFGFQNGKTDVPSLPCRPNSGTPLPLG